MGSKRNQKSRVLSDTDVERMRLDRWLKAARIFKTRSWSKQACEQGRVKIGRKRAKPSTAVAVGDTVSINRRGKVTVYEILGLSNRSLPPGKARELYNVKEVIEKQGSEIMKLIRRAEGSRGPSSRKGKPTKKERRDIRKVRGY
jgi:ribosome-associated heat shock protein Hsp15